MTTKLDRQEMTLGALMAEFHSDDACRARLEQLRWPSGVACLRCGSMTLYPMRGRGQYDCVDCGYQFSVTVGTIFQDTHLPLWKWFTAVYIMTESKKGVSANQLHRMLDVSYKTAWYLCHRIRAALTEAQPAMLSGTVEVDETFIGGRRRHVGRGFTANKSIVAGGLQRGGLIRLKVVDNRSRETLHGFIHEHVGDGAEAIYTDEWAPYSGIADENTRHETVNHSVEEWVRGDVHTQGIEGAWSLFKRSIVGAFHHVSEKHLDAYLDEFEFRFNNRENPYLFRDTLVKLLQAEKIEYKTLTAR